MFDKPGARAFAGAAVAGNANGGVTRPVLRKSRKCRANCRQKGINCRSSIPSTEPLPRCAEFARSSTRPRTATGFRRSLPLSWRIGAIVAGLAALLLHEVNALDADAALDR